MVKMRSARRLIAKGSWRKIATVDNMKEMKTCVRERVSDIPLYLRFLALIGLAMRGY
jgi:hypothetical protein